MTDRFLVLPGIVLPEGDERPVPAALAVEITHSLNEMAETGWFFVGAGSQYVPNHGVQNWVVFRREEG